MSTSPGRIPDPTSLIRAEVRGLTAYHVEAPDPASIRAKLDANESPFALGDHVRTELAAELAKALADVELHRYPDPQARALRRQLAAELGVPAEHVLATNGSDEGIQILLQAAAGPGVAVAIPVPTFAMYELGARVLGLRVVAVPLDATYDLDLERFRAALRAERPRLVFLAWPNNPTGRLYARDAVERIVQACAGEDCEALVVVDEAYVHYSGQSLLDRLGAHPHLVLLRTLSKVGLAGIRLGLVIGHPAVLAELNKVRLPYNVNALSQAAARVVLRHPEVVRQHAATIVRERERVLRALRRLPGLRVFPSGANFFLMRAAQPGQALWRALLERGVLVRDFSRAPHLSDCLRVTIGTPEENDLFLQALGAILASGD
jgi:histidinol-phosphate aminotransferase